MLTDSQQRLLETIKHLEDYLLEYADLEWRLAETILHPLMRDEWALIVDEVLAYIKTARERTEKRWFQKCQEYNAEKGWGFDEP